jgi:hypothetical protein
MSCSSSPDRARASRCRPTSRSALRSPDRRPCQGRRGTRGHRQRDRVLSTYPGALRGGTQRTFSGGRARGRPRGDDVHRTGSARSPRGTRALRDCRDSSLRRVVLRARVESDLRLLVRSLRTGARAGCRLGDQTPRTGNIYGSGKDAFEQAYDMFRAPGPARRRRNELPQRRPHVSTCAHRPGLRRAQQSPAGLRALWSSAGLPAPAFRVFRSPGRMTSMSPATASPGRSTSRRFTPRCSTKRPTVRTSRGLRIADANKVTPTFRHCEHRRRGRTVHVGHLEAQVDRMLDNIVAACPAGASLKSGVGDRVSQESERCAGSAFDASRARLDGFPCAVVEAPLCRPDLLCETEAVALLPPSTAGA